MKNKLFLISCVCCLQLLCAETPYSDMDEPFFQSPRTTALGMAGVALADTPEAIFYNPALQTEAHGIQWYGSSHKVLDDIQTIHTAVTIPLGRWAIGAGYITTHVPGVGIIPESLESIDLNGRPMLDQVQDAALDRTSSYLGAAFLLIDKGDWLKRCSFGIALKSYNVQVSGVSLRDANANGFNVDLGLYAQFNKIWSLGLTARNVMASPLRWQNGSADILPRIYSVGNKFAYNDGGFIVLLDTDFYENQYQPNLIKAGVEVGLTKYLRVRTGLRQYLVARDSETLVLTGLTAGLGIRPLTDMSIDYAYFPGDGYAQNAVHYAGISFESFTALLPPTSQPVIMEKPKATKLKIIAPLDNLITENSSVLVQVLASGEQAVTINGVQVLVTANQAMQQYNLLPGLNQLVVSGRELSFERKVFKLSSYEELLASKNTKDAAAVILTNYYHQLLFSDATITRREAAEYIASSLQLPIPNQMQGVFSARDVLYLYGIYGSTAVTTLGDDAQALTKGELAILLARLDGYTYLFIDNDTPVNQAVEALVATGYYSQEDFYPISGTVSRRECLAALARSSKVTQRLMQEYKDLPIFWVRTAYAGCTVYAPNAGVVSVVAQINADIISVSANGLYSIPVIIPQISGNTRVTLDIMDGFNNQRIFVIDIPPRPLLVEPTQSIQLASPPTAGARLAFVPVAQKTVTGSSQSTVLTKTVPKTVRVGEKTSCYVGIMGVPEILKVTCSFSDEKLSALLVAPGLWKVEKLITKKTAAQYTVFVKTVDGTYTAKGAMLIDGVAAQQAPIALQPEVIAQAVAIEPEPILKPEVKTLKIQTAPVPPRALDVPDYSPEIMLYPASPAAGSVLKMKVKVNLPRIVKVTAEIEDVKTYLVWSKQGFWYGEKIIPKRFSGKKMFVHIFVKDSAGKFSMTEKIISVR